MSIRVIYFHNEPGKPKVAVAEISDDIGHATDSVPAHLAEQANTIKNLNYRRQWLGTRLLLRSIEPSAGEIIYTPEGKPVLPSMQKELSISHTSKYCAVALSDLPTGLDIEIIGNKVERISSRFLSESEKAFAGSSIQKHIIWGAKEAMFKAWSKGNVQFNCDIIVSPFEYQSEGTINATFRDRIYTLGYKKLDQLMLVYLLD